MDLGSNESDSLLMRHHLSRLVTNDKVMNASDFSFDYSHAKKSASIVEQLKHLRDEPIDSAVSLVYLVLLVIMASIFCLIFGRKIKGDLHKMRD